MCAFRCSGGVACQVLCLCRIAGLGCGLQNHCRCVRFVKLESRGFAARGVKFADVSPTYVQVHEVLLCGRKIQLDTRKHRHHTCKGQVLHAAVLAVQARCVAQPGASCGGRFVLPVPRRRANHHTLPRRPRPGPSRGDRLPPEPPPQSACRQRGSCLRTSHTVFIAVLRCASSGATLAVTTRHVHVCLPLSHHEAAVEPSKPWWARLRKTETRA